MTAALRRTPGPLAAIRLAPRAERRSPWAALVEEAQEAETQGRRAEARQLYERALRRLPEASSGAEASSLLRWIARTYRVDAELDLALDCAGAAIAVAEAHGDHAAIGHATNLQAIIHWQQGKLDAAEQLYHLANQSALRASEAKLSAMIAQNLGVIANIRGDLDRALGHYESSLAAYRRLGLAADVCVALNNLGLLFTQRGQWAEAERSYDEATCVADALGDQKSLVQIDVNRAECLVVQGKLAEAHLACERATARAARMDDCGVLGELHKAYGIVERERGDADAAERHLLKAREIAAQRHDMLLLAESTKECAVLHRQQGRNRDTLQCLNQAHRLFAQLRARLELADVGRRMEHLELDFLDVVRRWGESIEGKDEYTQGHCERVADMACALAERTGMDEQSLFWFRIGALLHDVGKLVIPAQVLNKAGGLTPEEWELVRHHPSAGVEMLADVEFPWDVRPIVESHHERWDGRGYPHGLAGESIPMVARILCFADVYDALTSRRSYKKPMSHEEAMDVMRLESGKQFDPALFALFEQVAPRFADAASRRGAPARPVPATPLAPVVTATTPGHVDELTGLPLRRAFMDAAATALRQERTADAGVAILVIDVDQFKAINDSHGHLRGDAVLRLVADTLRAHAGADDLVARFGGDEFLVLMPRTTAADAVALAERVRVAMHALPMADRAVGPNALTVSIGVAVASSQDAAVEPVFARADAALFEAKRRGRDAVVAPLALPECAEPEARSLRLDRFVGREGERRILGDLMDSATRGQPRVLVITGEPGIGKTSLARELASEARLRGASLVSTRCVEGTRGPLQPWRAMLDAIRVLRVVPERSWRALGTLVPALPQAGAAGESFTDNRVLFAEVVDYLRLATRERPIVLMVDDAHRADAQSAELLQYLLAHLEADRLLVVLAMRPGEARQDAWTNRRLLPRDERVRHLALSPLTARELAAVLHRALGHEAEAGLVGHMHDLTGGNPLYLVELLQGMSASGALRCDGTRWLWTPSVATPVPSVVHDLLMARLDHLSRESRRTLGRVAVMGRTIEIDLAVAAGLVAEADLLDAIEDGMAASVLHSAPGDAEDQVAFVNTLLVEVLQEGLHPRRRRRMRESLERARADAARPRRGLRIHTSSDAALAAPSRHAVGSGRAG